MFLNAVRDCPHNILACTILAVILFKSCSQTKIGGEYRIVDAWTKENIKYGNMTIYFVGLWNFPYQLLMATNCAYILQIVSKIPTVPSK